MNTKNILHALCVISKHLTNIWQPRWFRAICRDEKIRLFSDFSKSNICIKLFLGLHGGNHNPNEFAKRFDNITEATYAKACYISHKGILAAMLVGHKHGGSAILSVIPPSVLCSSVSLLKTRSLSFNLPSAKQ